MDTTLKSKAETTPQLSIVVPLYNESSSLTELTEWIDRVCRSAGLAYELLLVDDGSRDDGWAQIVRLAGLNPHIRGVHLERNYGKSAALYEGFQRSRAAVVITMDADLQDSPDEIPALYAMVANEGYDLVSGWKKKRFDAWHKRAYSKIFNKVVATFSGIALRDFNCGIKAYAGVAVRSVYLYGDLHRYMPLLVYWMGYRKIGERVVRHYPRVHGKSKYGIGRIWRGILDLFSVGFMVRFGRRPMHFFGFVGLLSFVLGGGIVVYLLLVKLHALYYGVAYRDIVEQPLFYISLVGVVVGVQCFLAAFITELFLFVVERKRSSCVDKVIEQTGG